MLSNIQHFVTQEWNLGCLWNVGENGIHIIKSDFVNNVKSVNWQTHNKGLSMKQKLENRRKDKMKQLEFDFHGKYIPSFRSKSK